jgi:hypothetical protein
MTIELVWWWVFAYSNILLPLAIDSQRAHSSLIAMTASAMVNHPFRAQSEYNSAKMAGKKNV